MSGKERARQMEDPALIAYSDARTEYTKQLCQTIAPATMKLFLDMLAKSREETRSEPKKVLWHFQTLLSELPDWNMDRVAGEIDRLQSAIGCEYLEDLITAVFIAHTKILTAIRMSTRKKKVQITVPKLEHFLFKVLIETSKIFWKSTYLFRDDVSNIEKQQNYRQIEGLVNDGISQAIRCMVPVKSILRDCVVGDDEDDDAVVAAAAADSAADSVEEEASAAPALALAPAEEVPVAAPAPAEDSLAEIPIETITVESIAAAAEAPEAPELLSIEQPQKVEFAEYKSVYNMDDPEETELILDEGEDASIAGSVIEEPFEEFEDLDAPVSNEFHPIDDFETLE